MSKTAVRERAKAVSIKEREEKDGLINQAVLNLDDYKNREKILVFMPSGKEPNISPIIASAFLDGKRVFAPVTSDVIKVAEITENTIFTLGKFGIREPKDCRLTDELPDAALIPMVAYDKNLGRLGHGKGYYDRFLRGKNIRKIGVCYSDFETESVYSDEFDVKMDIIVTDGSVIV